MVWVEEGWAGDLMLHEFFPIWVAIWICGKNMSDHTAYF